MKGPAEKASGQELDGRFAVVTGASRGIGRGIALELACMGAKVAGVYEKDEVSASKTLADMGGESAGHRMFQADVSSEEEVAKLSDSVLSAFPRVDILVNNAGIHQHLKSWELSESDWHRVINVNLTSQFLMSKAFGKGMRERRQGRIVNVASMIARTGTDHEVHYAASKGGSVSLTRALALEYAPHGVTVNAVAPGYIRTDMLVFDSPEDEETYRRKIPLARYGEPSDIAKAVAFLCTDGAAYITGQVVHVNGGLLMG